MTNRLARLLGAVVATILLTLPMTGHARQASTRELQALSPNAANRAVQADLLSIFKPTREIRSGMFRRLRGVGLTTHAFGTEFRDLCERDLATLWYAPARNAGTQEKVEDQPVQPYQLTSSRTFRFLSPPEPDDAAEYDRPAVWSSKCRATDDSDDDWFVAEDSFSAVQGALVLRAMVDELKAGRLTPEPCSLYDKKQTCTQAILGVADLGKIGAIKTCSAPRGSLCYVIDLAGMTLVTITGRGDSRVANPTAILSVAIEEYIMVT